MIQNKAIEDMTAYLKRKGRKFSLREDKDENTVEISYKTQIVSLCEDDAHTFASILKSAKSLGLSGDKGGAVVVTVVFEEGE